MEASFLLTQENASNNVILDIIALKILKKSRGRHMLLHKGSFELVNYLLASNESKTIMAISKELQVSRRKIYYHLEKINDALPEEIEKIIAEPRKGLLLDANQKVACRSLLMSVNTYTYMMTADERMQLIIVYICLSRQRVTLEKLMALTETSRNTVLNDLNVIRNELANNQYKISLYTSKSEGYFLKGSALGRVQYMHSVYNHIFSSGSTGFLKIVRGTISDIKSDINYKDLRELFENQVPILERNLGKKINKYELKLMFQTFPLVLMCCWNMRLTRSEIENTYNELELIKKRIEYKVAIELADVISSEISIRLNPFEIVTIALLLLSYRKDSDEHVTSKDWQDLKKVIDTCVNYFEEHSAFRLEQKNELSNALLSHAKALLFRKKYGIVSVNPLTAQIKEKYPEVFQLTKVSAQLLEESWRIKLIDDDIAYLTIHFGGALKNNKSRQQNSQIYVICDEGIAVQKLLIKQLYQYIPEEEIKAVFTTEQFKSIEGILDSGLLISTNSLETDLPFIHVHPILTAEDIVKINKSTYFQIDKFSKFNQNLENLLSNYIQSATAVTECKASIQKMIHQHFLS